MDMEMEQARDILTRLEAGTHYVPDLISLARQTVGSAAAGSAPLAGTDDGLAALHASAGDGGILLGLQADGRPVTSRDVETAGLGVLKSISSFTPTGRAAVDAFQEAAAAPLLARAAELKLDVPALRAYAQEKKLDFTETLKEAIAAAELGARCQALIAGEVVDGRR
jgi:hypothetical protein